MNNPDYTAVINQRHYARLNQLAQDCEKYPCLWPVGNDKKDDVQIFPPLLIVNPDLDSSIMQSEIFGPILPIIAVKSTEQALEIINNKPNLLTLYIFSNQKKYIKNILDKTLSGSVAVNETIVQFAQDDIGFGGVGESGMGPYHGQNGFNSFSHLKTVYYQSRVNIHFTENS